MPRLIGRPRNKPIEPLDAVNDSIPEGLSMEDAEALVAAVETTPALVA